ncbi:MAG: hypothetical protein ACRDPJ_10990 [Nocardioidaceae bacterium]
MEGAEIRAVTAAVWPDLDAVFSAKGSPGYCWRTMFCSVPGGATDRVSRKAEMESRVRSGERSRSPPRTRTAGSDSTSRSRPP